MKVSVNKVVNFDCLNLTDSVKMNISMFHHAHRLNKYACVVSYFCPVCNKGVMHTVWLFPHLPMVCEADCCGRIMTFIPKETILEWERG